MGFWICPGGRRQDCHVLLDHASVSATATQLEGIVAGPLELDAPGFPVSEQM